MTLHRIRARNLSQCPYKDLSHRQVIVGWTYLDSREAAAEPLGPEGVRARFTVFVYREQSPETLLFNIHHGRISTSSCPFAH